MILTVGLQPFSPLAGVEESATLPEPPALSWTGFLISCCGNEPKMAVLDWTVGIKAARPGAPIGMVVPEDASTDLVNLAIHLGVDPVVRNPDELAAYFPSRDNWGPLIVPGERFFVLGDRRDSSIAGDDWAEVSIDVTSWKWNLSIQG